MKTPTTTATVIPRHGRSGITRSKLEVDECIAAALGENDCARHQEPHGSDDPPRKTSDGGFERDIAQRPVREKKEKSHDPDLKNLARGQDGFTGRVPAKHSADQAAGGLEVGGAEINPRDQHGDISG